MSALVLAQMMSDDRDHMGNGWWWVMGIGSLVIVALLVVLVVALIRNVSPRDSTPYPAESVLADRFARGEIDEDEYRRRRAALRA